MNLTSFWEWTPKSLKSGMFEANVCVFVCVFSSPKTKLYCQSCSNRSCLVVQCQPAQPRLHTAPALQDWRPCRRMLLSSVQSAATSVGMHHSLSSICWYTKPSTTKLPKHRYSQHGLAFYDQCFLIYVYIWVASFTWEKFPAVYKL